MSTSFLHFNGTSTYIDVEDTDGFSLLKTGLTVSAWIRPSTLTFPHSEPTERKGVPVPIREQYVHWMGKGQHGTHEWALRMYNQDTSGAKDARNNWISFYVFNPDGGLGVGSHSKRPVEVGEWIHVVGTANRHKTHIYRDGKLEDQDVYEGQIKPMHGNTNLQIGTKDLHSHFEGEIREVRIWSRALSKEEVQSLFVENLVPQDGLVAEYLLTSPDPHDANLAVDMTGKHNGTIHDGSIRS
jgi:hypothetical protein